MRIVIEIDGKQLVTTDMSTLEALPEGGLPASIEPSAELLRAAQALGAQSAGPAAFVKPAGAAVRRAPSFATTGLAASKKQGADLDAGVAQPVATHASAAPGRAAKRSAKERAK